MAEDRHYTQVLFPTPSVNRITAGVAFLVILGLVSVINSTPVFPHMSGDAMHVKSLSEISLNQRRPKSSEFIRVMCTLALEIVRGGSGSLDYFVIALGYVRS